MTNVADKLRTRPKRWPWLIAAPATALLVAGTWAGASALTHAAPAPTATAVVADTPTQLTAGEIDAVQQIADDQQAALIAQQQAAAAAEAQAEADAAAAAAAKAEASKQANRNANPSGLPSGAVDPLNEFGSPDTTKCASGSASDNSDGVAICD